jgi:hypothetical protein
MIWTRDEYIALMTFQKTQRSFLAELFGPLVGLPEQWRAGGATEDEIALTAFGFDGVDLVDLGALAGPIHAMKPAVLEETATHIVTRDELGRTCKLAKGYATIALPLDWPVRDFESWRRVKHMFEYDSCRIDKEKLADAAVRRASGALVIAWMPGGYDMVRELMGDEEACVAFLEQPELIEDMLGTFSCTARRALGEIARFVTVDNLCVHEDMAGKSGPLIGPNQVRTFLKPYYRGVWDDARGRGAALFSQDSDGNMNPVMDAFVESGVNVFYPCEPAAGMDIAQLRLRYGTAAAFKGGLDKHVLRKSATDIDRELSYKIRPETIPGTVFALDHRIPNGTPIENYRHYVKTARRLLGLPENPEPGWMRMAF